MWPCTTHRQYILTFNCHIAIIVQSNTCTRSKDIAFTREFDTYVTSYRLKNAYLFRRFIPFVRIALVMWKFKRGCERDLQSWEIPRSFWWALQCLSIRTLVAVAPIGRPSRARRIGLDKGISRWGHETSNWTRKAYNSQHWHSPWSDFSDLEVSLS